MEEELDVSRREKLALERSHAKQEQELEMLRRDLEEARRLREEERANKDPWIVAATEMPTPKSPNRRDRDERSDRGGPSIEEDPDPARTGREPEAIYEVTDHTLPALERERQARAKRI